MSELGNTTMPPARRSRKSTSGLSPSRKAMEKENATVDVATSLAASRKKSRSKSIGPGGLDVLKPGAGNRRVSLAAPSRPPPRSILKPTIPILAEIPPHKPKQAPASSGAAAGDSGSGSGATVSTRSSDDDLSGTKVALRTEEEQQAAAREREERERAELEKEVNDRREARRKSLANRRVSFAAEATLHTFHEIEYLQDSTTSTDSTRRASSLAATSPAPTPLAQQQEQQHASGAPDSSVAPPEDDTGIVPESPSNQRDLHQKTRRRSSGISALDDTLNSTVYSSDSEHGDDIIEDAVEDASESGSDSDDNDGTMMTVEEVTSASALSAGSVMSQDSTASLDEMLRIATQRAEARAAEQRADEGEEVIPAFVGWGKKAVAGNNRTAAAPPSEPDEDEEDEENGVDMDITGAVGGIVNNADSSPVRDVRDEDEDMSMDMSMDLTKPMGGIMPSRNQNMQARPDQTCAMDQTMDFTMAMGGIQSATGDEDEPENDSDSDSNEDMSMEMTNVLGGVLSQSGAGGTKGQNRRRTILSGAVADCEQDMDVDMTVGMEMTTALGGIVKPTSPQSDETKRTMAPRKSPNKAKSPSRTRTAQATPSASEKSRNLSPERCAFGNKGLRRSPDRGSSPVRAGHKTASVAHTKAPAESPAQPQTPERSPDTKFIGSRSRSPKRPVSPHHSGAPTSASKSKPSTRQSIFHQDPSTGATTPRVVLTPQRRRLSGIGADRPGLGSPKVAEMLERRSSIGESARNFVPGLPGDTRRIVAFEDPRILEQEIDRERQEEKAKEDGRTIMEREANGMSDDRDVTLNLKELIQGLSPKKNLHRARKSLHVGSAKGLLGKRPAELDEAEDDDEQQDGIKRLKGHKGSPVKNIRLQHPPSKAETTGRLTRSAKNKQAAAASIATPSPGLSPNRAASSPKGQTRFRDVDQDTLPVAMSFDDPGLGATDEDLMLDADQGEEDRISLQEFLNMTSIRFMELNTTKRRHTVAPSANRDSHGEDIKPDVSFERCAVAGACTVPSLEMYQHSCRELKKYISEGRDIVRDIETETLQDNPPLFREYMSATPEFKLLMDNQFKNVKTHARLLSKAMWYDWRMKLQSGLKDGLCKTAEGLDGDDQVLRKQQDLLDSVLPSLSARFEALDREHQALDEAARELADCDPEELQAARDDLQAVTGDIAEKKRRIAELQRELRESETGAASLAEQKQQCLEEIRKAERVREECRGWSSGEIMAIKARVEAMETEHGWAVTGCAGTTISMTYLREIELVFDPTNFLDGCGGGGSGRGRTGTGATIDLWHVAANRERDPAPLTPEKEFFLQCIRDQLRGVDPTRTPLSRMLGMARAGWGKAAVVADHVRSLNLTFPTRVCKTSDASVEVRSAVFLAAVKAKVEVVVGLHCSFASSGVDGDGDGNSGIHVAVAPRARVVYGGEHFSREKMNEFLAARIGNGIVMSSKDGSSGKKMGESWGDVVVALHAKLLSAARK